MVVGPFKESWMTIPFGYDHSNRFQDYTDTSTNFQRLLAHKKRLNRRMINSESSTELLYVGSMVVGLFKESWMTIQDGHDHSNRFQDSCMYFMWLRPRILLFWLVFCQVAQRVSSAKETARQFFSLCNDYVYRAPFGIPTTPRHGKDPLLWISNSNFPRLEKPLGY
jgi:hypothetical protein